MSSGLILGLQGLPYGTYGYHADVIDLDKKVCLARQTLREHMARQSAGHVTAKSGRDLAECIAIVSEKLAAAEAAYDRARAEL